MGATTYGRITADGQYHEHTVGSGVSTVESGVFMQLDAVGGSWGGGTVILQYFAQDGVWRELFGNSYTSDSSEKVSVPNGVRVRPKMSGSTAPDLFYQLTSME